MKQLLHLQVAKILAIIAWATIVGLISGALVSNAPLVAVVVVAIGLSLAMVCGAMVSLQPLEVAKEFTTSNTQPATKTTNNELSRFAKEHDGPAVLDRLQANGTT